MPRAYAIQQSEFPYQITARCINKDWFKLPLPEVWSIFCDELTRVSHEQDFVIYSFVLMNNHFHLIALTPQANISQIMLLFMGRTSRRLTLAGNRINETFAGRHYKCILNSPFYLMNAYKYNYRNPVGAGICKTVEEYPFSTLQDVLGKRQKSLPLQDPLFENEKPLETLNWLNTPPDPEKLKACHLALKRPYFKSQKNRMNGQLILGDREIL